MLPTVPPCCPDTAFQFYRKCIFKWDTFLPARGWFLSHDVSHTSKQRSALNKQLVQIENKCGWIDGWSQIQNTSKACMLSFFLSSILICCHLAFAHSRCALLSIMTIIPQGETGQTDRQTDSQWKAPIWIYCLCSCTGHTAVFTLNLAMSIRWHCPGLEMWLPIHPPPPSPQTPPSPLPFFSLCAPWHYVLKKNPNMHFPQKA